RRAQRQQLPLMCSGHKEDRLPDQSWFVANLGLRLKRATSNPWPLSARAGSGKTRGTAVRGESADNSTAFATRVASSRQAPEEQKQLCTRRNRQAPPAQRRNEAAAIAEFSSMRRVRFPTPGLP